MCRFKFITGLVSENSLEVNVLTSRKDSWNLQKSTFIQLFHHTDPNSVRKNYFQSDLRLKDCLITRWLATTSIVSVVEIIYRYRLKSNYLKNDKFFARFSFCIFNIYIKFSMFWKKKWAWSVELFWSYLLWRTCLFKCITGLVSENSLAVNVLTSPKNSWNLQKSTCIWSFYYSVPYWVRKAFINEI